MNFAEALNRYMEESGCTGKKLSEKSGISIAAISRYRNGICLPDIDSERLWHLAEGLAAAAEEKGSGIRDAAVLHHQLSEAVHEAADSFDYEVLRTNMDALLQTTSISLTELARHSNYDVSYLSRVRSGKRRPRDPLWLAQALAKYTVSRCYSSADRAKLAELIGCEKEELENRTEYFERLFSWVSSGRDDGKEDMTELVAEVDSFDPEAFISNLRMEDLEKPSDRPAFLTKSAYVGVQGMVESEIDFLRAAAASGTGGSLVIYSDLPVGGVYSVTFQKKRAEYLATLLRQGVHLDLIQNINRPFRDIMNELEAWIPLYMSGQVSTYYIDYPGESPFHHLVMVAGDLALRGEVIGEKLENGRFHVTRTRSEVKYLRESAERLLRSAKPLVDIYYSDRAAELEAFLEEDRNRQGFRREFLSAPPIYTLGEKLLGRILRRAGVEEETASCIRDYVEKKRTRVEAILSGSQIHLELSPLTREEFEASPVALSLGLLFPERDLFYTYEEYREHLDQTETFAARNPNYLVTMGGRPLFRNIQIAIRRDEFALISKNRAPVIHFVMRHPRMVGSLENMTSRWEDSAEAPAV